MHLCKELDYGEEWHIDDLLESCTTSKHILFQRVAIVFIFVYSFGVPLYFFFKMYRVKQFLNGEEEKERLRERLSEGTQTDPLITKQNGDAYRDSTRTATQAAKDLLHAERMRLTTLKRRLKNRQCQPTIDYEVRVQQHTSGIMRSVSEDTEHTQRSVNRARRQSVVKLIHKIDNRGGSAASLVSKQTEECLLHVGNIGPGGCKSVELLTEIFHRYGDVFSATICDRVDKNTGQDSSWALVQMTDAAGASKALAAAANDRDEFGADTIAALDGVTRLWVTLFDKKRAVSSKGGMKHTAKAMLLTGTITSSAMKIVLFAHRIIMRAKR